MTNVAYLISALILIAAGVACARVPAQPDGEPIIITPVAFQTQTPADIIAATPIAVEEVPTAAATPSPTPIPIPTATPTPWPAATATPTPLLLATATPIPTQRPTSTPIPVSNYKPMVSGGDRLAAGGTRYDMAYDGDLTTFLESNYHIQQFIQVDFDFIVEFSGVRRYMTRDGADATGYRNALEQVSYSMDGMNWKELKVATTRGWEDYTIDSRYVWRSLEYGWSPWLRPKTPVRARHVRFYWDSKNDALNEIELDWVFPPG